MCTDRRCCGRRLRRVQSNSLQLIEWDCNEKSAGTGKRLGIICLIKGSMRFSGWGNITWGWSGTFHKSGEERHVGQKWNVIDLWSTLHKLLCPDWWHWREACGGLVLSEDVVPWFSMYIYNLKPMTLAKVNLCMIYGLKSVSALISAGQADWYIILHWQVRHQWEHSRPWSTQCHSCWGRLNMHLPTLFTTLLCNLWLSPSLDSMEDLGKRLTHLSVAFTFTARSSQACLILELLVQNVVSVVVATSSLTILLWSLIGQSLYQIFEVWGSRTVGPPSISACCLFLHCTNKTAGISRPRVLLSLDCLPLLPLRYYWGPQAPQHISPGTLLL